MEKESNKSLEFYLSETGSNLYIFFGGIANGIAMPPFEFFNSSKIIEEHKIFIRDLSQRWYQNGLYLVTSDVSSTIAHISKLITDINPNKVYFVGNSMGGFAAIMFSSLMGIGNVIAFAPQTFIAPQLKLAYGDFRWKEQILKTYLATIFKKTYFDLKPLLVSSQKTNQVSIFVSENNKLDFAHATRLNNIDGLTIHSFNEGDHDIVKILRNKGMLPKIMSGEF